MHASWSRKVARSERSGFVEWQMVWIINLFFTVVSFCSQMLSKTFIQATGVSTRIIKKFITYQLGMVLAHKTLAKCNYS